MTSRLKGIRQHLRVTMPDETFNVWTKPFDYTLFAQTARRHDWPDHTADPVGYLLFLAWSAARHDGKIPVDLKFEAFKEQVEDLEELEPEEVGPTDPAPGAG